MSDSSTAIFPKSTNVKVNECEVINAGRDLSHMTYNVQNSYNIVFPDVISVFQHFTAWIRSGGRDPVEISDIVPLQIPPLPVSSVADRYTRSMLECLVGYPLYNPKPFSESKEYLRNGVNIGDVGFVRKDGTFDCLFNICPSHNELINPPNLPNGFSLEQPDHSATRDLDSLPPNTSLFPHTVTKTESDEYTCKESAGATLVLPEGAIQAEAIYEGLFEDLAKRHGVEWYAYTKTRGRSISNGSLYLVTSFTKCTRWGIAVFDRPSGPGQALTFVSSPLGWKGSGTSFTKVSDPKQGDTPNQCVFLGGYKIMIRQDIFDKLPTRQLASRIRGGGGTGFTSRIKKVLTGEIPLARPTKSTVTKPDEVILQANFNSSPVHPSDLINTELLNQNPDAKVALTHDDIWCDILRDNFPGPNYEKLMKIVRSYTRTIDEFGCISLEKVSDRISDSSNVLEERSRLVRGTDTLDLTDQIECTTEFIGRGGSAYVYKGRWVEQAVTAVKVMNLVSSPIDERKKEKQSKQIKRELEVWRKIDHKNIWPSLVAYINLDTHIPAFTYPCMENGNAKQLRLHDLSFPPLLILHDVIQGLHYLHTFKPEIIHGDIKADNVLINDRYEARLCEFRFSRLADGLPWRTTASQTGDTLRWMSPELMNGNQCTPTKESDIYAYAMTCYEIITCDIPFKSVRNYANLQYSVAVEKQRPQHVESRDLDDMWEIITKCWAEEPGDRPRTAEVLKMVQKRKENSGERSGSRPELTAGEQITEIKTGQVTKRGDGGTGKIGTEIGTLTQLKPYSSASATASLIQENICDLTGKIECITSEFIGRGGFGCVFKGRWVEEAANAIRPPIVVKVMKQLLSPASPMDEKQKKRQSRKIERELKLWSKIKHKNILPLLGIAYINPDNNIPSFISPWMNNGNAKQFCLRNPDFPPLLILHDVIQGLHFLHTFEAETVHGDIKANNVLINSINNRYEARLCDAGLSRFLVDNSLWRTTAIQTGSNLRWMSPELMTGKQCIPTKESDIYAYAMTCYEIITCDIPFKSVRNDAGLMYSVTVEKQRPQHVESCDINDMWNVITKCWADEPEDRPRAAEVLELVWKRTPPDPSSIGRSHSPKSSAFTISNHYTPETYSFPESNQKTIVTKSTNRRYLSVRKILETEDERTVEEGLIEPVSRRYLNVNKVLEN